MSICFNFTFSSNQHPSYFNQKTNSIYICGSTEQLGNWNIRNAIELKTTDSYKWSLEIEQIDVPKIEYKYFIAKKTTDNKRFFIKKVEAEFRVLMNSQTNPNRQINDVWGYITDTGGVMRINTGWLLENETELRLNFHNHPLRIFSKYKADDEKKKRYAITIKPFKIDNDEHLTEVHDYLHTLREFNSEHIFDEPETLNALNSSDYFGIANIRTFEDPKNLLFQIRIDGFADNYLKVPQQLLETSLTKVELTLHSSDTQQLVGHLNVELLLIRSLVGDATSITTNYNYDYTKACLATGHRGIGKTFDAESLEHTDIIENTIESFQEASNKGAQMVEFDIVLTKDNQVVVYHDYAVCIKSELNENKYIDIGVHQLTYEELKNSKVYAHKILKKQPGPNEISKYSSEKMFPTLKEVFETTNENLAFDIEIKYPLELEDGNNEADASVKWMDRNKYVDIILNELLSNCKVNKRSAVLTSFDSYICAMLNMKQNRFPVLFITNGITKKWVPYSDLRSKTTKISTIFAKADDLNGVVLHAEELINDRALFEFLQKVKKESDRFLVYVWGDDLNKMEIRQLFSKLSFDAIIYDRINEL